MEVKDLINDTLDFWKYKLNNDLCTPEELTNLAEIAQKELKTYGTIEDLAKFFGVPESSVRNVISRRVIEKPKRRVYYRFQAVLKNIPVKWLNKNK